MPRKKHTNLKEELKRDFEKIIYLQLEETLKHCQTAIAEFQLGLNLAVAQVEMMLGGVGNRPLLSNERKGLKLLSNRMRLMSLFLTVYSRHSEYIIQHREITVDKCKWIVDGQQMTMDHSCIFINVSVTFISQILRRVEETIAREKASKGKAEETPKESESK